MQVICDAADADAGAVLRALRENYLTPFDRRDMFVLADTIRQTCHSLDSVGYTMSSGAFSDLPDGVIEMLAILSDEADHTVRMTRRLSRKLDQWDYVDSINSLHNRAVKLQHRITDAKPASRMGLTHMSATLQLGSALVSASEKFTQIGRVIAEIAVRES